jgi:hypothetical protein
MVVYIAHSPRHNSFADVARAGVAAGSMAKAACSEDFDDRGAAKGDNHTWGTLAQALTDATLFLVLLPPADPPIDMMSIGMELGTYLQICKHANKRVSVACLHHLEESCASIIARCAPDEVRAVPGTDADVMAFIKVYYPDADELLRQTISGQLVRALGAGGPPIERYPTAPTLTITTAESMLESLSSGKIPPTAMIGGHQWWVLFGLAPGVSGILWQDLRTSLQSPDTWEPILAEELDFVRRAPKNKKKQREVIPILATANVPPTAAVLQKYEVLPGVAAEGGGVGDGVAILKDHRFTLAAFVAPMLYDPADLNPLSNAFHLVTVAQLFRFILIGKDLPELERLKSLSRANMPDFEQELSVAIGNLRRHILLIDVESRRRNFSQRFGQFDRIVYDAYQLNEGADQTADAKQKRLSEIMPAEWMPIAARLENSLTQGQAGLRNAIDAIKALAALNAEVIQISAECYSRLASRH